MVRNQDNTREDFVADIPPAPLAGTRAQALRRLQVGLAGLGAMLLIVALSTIITDRVRESDATTVPDAAPTTAPKDQAPVPKGDPLAEGGIVPDLPAEPSPTSTQSPAILPEQGQPLEPGEE